jgi:hypothetical protein
MKTNLFSKTATLVALAGALLALPAAHCSAQTVVDEIEVLRSALKADRKVVIAEGMKLTDKESTAFWPIYRDYRNAMDKVNDGIVKLVLEYADDYPDVPAERAKKMLADYLAFEKKQVSVRAAWLKKFAKVLPATKALRLAQLENRLDLTLRLQLAARIPLMPAANGK